jgi:hypothetical protein
VTITAFESFGVEGGFAVALVTSGSAMLRASAGEDKQAAGWTELVGRGAVQGEVPGAEQQAEDGQVYWGRDERCDPNGYAQSKREVEDVAEAEGKVRPMTVPMMTVTA